MPRLFYNCIFRNFLFSIQNSLICIFDIFFFCDQVFFFIIKPFEYYN